MSAVTNLPKVLKFLHEGTQAQKLKTSEEIGRMLGETGRDRARIRGAERMRQLGNAKLIQRHEPAEGHEDVKFSLTSLGIEKMNELAK